MFRIQRVRQCTGPLLLSESSTHPVDCPVAESTATEDATLVVPIGFHVPLPQLQAPDDVSDATSGSTEDDKADVATSANGAAAVIERAGDSIRSQSADLANRCRVIILGSVTVGHSSHADAAAEQAMRVKLLQFNRDLFTELVRVAQDHFAAKRQQEEEQRQLQLTYTPVRRGVAAGIGSGRRVTYEGDSMSPPSATANARRLSAGHSLREMMRSLQEYEWSHGSRSSDGNSGSGRSFDGGTRDPAPSDVSDSLPSRNRDIGSSGESASTSESPPQLRLESDRGASISGGLRTSDSSSVSASPLNVASSNSRRGGLLPSDSQQQPLALQMDDDDDHISTDRASSTSEADAWSALPFCPSSLWHNLGQLRLVGDATLPCSVQQYHDHFLADSASFSVSEVHRLNGDTDITTSAWEEEEGHQQQAEAAAVVIPHGTEGTVLRRVRLIMPLDPMPLAPKQTRVEKVQHYAQFGPSPLLVVESSSQSLDVPYGTYFHTRDVTLVVPADYELPPGIAAIAATLGGGAGSGNRAGGCRLLTFLRVDFSRKTVLRSTITPKAELGTAAFLRHMIEAQQGYLRNASLTRVPSLSFVAPTPAASASSSSSSSSSAVLSTSTHSSLNDERPAANVVHAPASPAISHNPPAVGAAAAAEIIADRAAVPPAASTLSPSSLSTVAVPTKIVLELPAELLHLVARLQAKATAPHVGAHHNAGNGALFFGGLSAFEVAALASAMALWVLVLVVAYSLLWAHR